MQDVNVSALSDELGVAFGTSGVRGLVASLTPELCFAFAAAFLKTVCPDAKQIAIGIDLRPSSPDIARACIAAAKANGVEAIYCGALPTPALAFYALQQSVPAIMVTGSHIPFDRNGIKFYRKDGEISKRDEAAIMSATLSLPAHLNSSLPSIPEVNGVAFNTFYDRYASAFPQDMLNGKRIGIYEHSSVARDLIKALMEHYGAEVVSLERTENFVPIDTEAVSPEDVAKGHSWAGKYQLDAIVSTDGDGDRPLVSDEKGEWLRGDILGVLCANYLHATHVAAPINVNSVLELEGEKQTPARKSLRTKIGSPYVIEGMEQLIVENPAARVVGYEANGGFLVGSDIALREQTLKALPTRDSILPILITFALSYDSNAPVSQLTKAFAERYTASDRLKEIPFHKSQKLLQDIKNIELIQKTLLASLGLHGELLKVRQLDETDGLRLHLSNDDIIHLRASGNAPELRCYAESNSAVQATNLVTNVLSHRLFSNI